MPNLFLLVIYLSFISLGLPDALLGAAWPTMRSDFSAELGAAGLIALIINMGTIISSLSSARLINAIGTGKITLFSCILTASALLGFAYSNSFFYLLMFGMLLGLGGGSVDTTLNHYVSENYKSKHMNWLHSCWGVGASMGPLMISHTISRYDSWSAGYLSASVVQFSLVGVLILSLPMWSKVAAIQKKKKQAEDSLYKEHHTQEVRNLLTIPGVKFTLLTFLCYCAIESSVGLWSASYLVEARGMTSSSSAAWTSLYFIGITVGRIFTGFFSIKISNRHLIFWGLITSLFGSFLICLPLSTTFAKFGLMAIGLGFAPVFPGFIHETPVRFGRANSARLIGYQMATAYTGMTFFPPIFGWIMTKFGIGLFPFFALLLIALVFFCSERVNCLIKKDSLQKMDSK